MNSNYLYLMHESFPPLHLNFSPSFLHSKKPKVQPLILWENILRGCLASKKMKMKEKEKQSKALYILYIYISILHTSISIYFTMDAREYIYREVFPTFLAKKSYGWWITRRRMEIYTKISKRKRSRVELAKQRRFRTKHGLVRNWKVLCEFQGVVRISHKPGAVVFRRPYLPHFSSKSYTV